MCLKALQSYKQILELQSFKAFFEKKFFLNPVERIGRITLISSQSPEFDAAGVDEVLKDGVDGKRGRGMDVEFGADVLAVGGDGVEREGKAVGYLLVGQAMGHQTDNLLFARRDAAVGDAGGDAAGAIVALGERAAFDSLDGGD